MMFAYQENPEAFGDAYNEAGLPEANGIPDIVDEITWGLDWLNRMNPCLLYTSHLSARVPFPLSPG